MKIKLTTAITIDELAQNVQSEIESQLGGQDIDMNDGWYEVAEVEMKSVEAIDGLLEFTCDVQLTHTGGKFVAADDIKEELIGIVDGLTVEAELGA